MLKRGQITVFIILGVLVFGTIIAVVYLKSAGTQEGMEAEETLVESGLAKDAITNYVESCLKKTIKDGILDNGLYGGYFTLPEESTTGQINNAPIYYRHGEDISPSNEVIAGEISKYVDSWLYLCLDEFKPFIEQGYDIISGNISSKGTLTPTKLIVETTLPLTVTLGSSITEVSGFRAEVPAKELYQDLEIVRKIASSVEPGGMVCMGCYWDLTSKKNLSISFFPVASDTLWFEVQDNKYVIDNKKFRLWFAVKYDETE